MITFLKNLFARRQKTTWESRLAMRALRDQGFY